MSLTGRAFGFFKFGGAAPSDVPEQELLSLRAVETELRACVSSLSDGHGTSGTPHLQLQVRRLEAAQEQLAVLEAARQQLEAAHQQLAVEKESKEAGNQQHEPIATDSETSEHARFVEQRAAAAVAAAEADLRSTLATETELRDRLEAMEQALRLAEREGDSADDAEESEDELEDLLLNPDVNPERGLLKSLSERTLPSPQKRSLVQSRVERARMVKESKRVESARQPAPEEPVQWVLQSTREADAPLESRASDERSRAVAGGAAEGRSSAEASKAESDGSEAWSEADEDAAEVGGMDDAARRLQAMRETGRSR